MDCEFIATGHYAKIADNNGRKYITKAKDERKDQSYVLWGLNQECMERTKFPLGPYTKAEVRQMAADYGYTDLSKKGESYEICFVPDNDYRGFLKRRVEGLEEKVAGGNFVDKAGNILGQHEGYPFYTIGQRKGLGIALGQPMYVNEIRPETNTVVLGDIKDLLRNGMTVGKLNWQKYESAPYGMDVTAQIRYNDRGTMSKILPFDDERVSVEFLANVKGVAPGQSAVFYEGDDIIGGGIIQGSLAF
jgi:tRNA-specific 2-thiouridylase